MSRRNALPCVVCDREIESMDDSYLNSPYAATAFETHGHYGSTIFDPMNGTFLELNICDPCIRRLASQGKILLGQDRKRVVCNHDGLGMPMFVGWLKVQRELTTWKPGTEHDIDLLVSPEEVGNATLYPEIEWHGPAVEVIKNRLRD